MSTRLRRLLAVVMMVTAMAVPLVAVQALSSAATNDAVEAVTPARTARPSLSASDLRDWRTAATVARGASVPLSVPVFFLLLAGIVGRYLRRIGDTGEDWRSLLEGAPPALP